MRRVQSILMAVGQIAEYLREQQWRLKIPEIIKTIGVASEVDRIYIFENHISDEGQLLCSQKYEWVAEGIKAEIDNPDLQNMPWEGTGFGDWFHCLKEGGTIASLTKDLSESKKQFLYEMQGILSISMVPIMVGEDFWGMMGFDDCTTERQWSDDELSALRAVANMFGALLLREKIQENEQKLQKALAEIQTLRGIIPLCSYCKKVRDDKGYWQQVDIYIRDHSQADISHGICPECFKKKWGDLESE